MKDVSRKLGRLVIGSRRRTAFRRYAAAVGFSVLSILLTLGIQEFDETPFFAVLLLAGIAAAIYGGCRPGILAAVLSALLTAFFILPPKYSFLVSHSGQIAKLLISASIGVGLAVWIGATGDLQLKLEEERERLRVTLAGIADAVITTDGAGRITYLNPAAEAITQWTDADAFGRHIEAVFRLGVNTQAILWRVQFARYCYPAKSWP